MKPWSTKCPECSGRGCKENGSDFHCQTCQLPEDTRCNFYQVCPPCEGSGKVGLRVEEHSKNGRLVSEDEVAKLLKEFIEITSPEYTINELLQQILIPQRMGKIILTFNNLPVKVVPAKECTGVVKRD
jgi:hypothetical protein